MKRIIELSVVIGCVAVTAFADRTWTGGGSDNYWTSAANWGGTAPVAGEALLFGGSLQLANTNDFDAGVLFSGITLNSSAGAFVFSGNGLSLGGDVVNLSANAATLALPLTVDVTRTINTSAGDLTCSGAINGAGGLSKRGTKTATFAASNSYAGATSVAEGRLNITDGSALGTTNQGTVVEIGAVLGVGNGITVDEPLSLVNYNPGSLRFYSGANTYRGLITITGGQARVKSDCGAMQVICGGITSLASTVILDSGGDAGSVLRIDEKPIWAASQKAHVHGTRTTVFGVAGIQLGTLEVAGGSLLLEQPNIWSPALRLEVGVSYARNCFIDLQGNDQIVGTLTGVITNDGVRMITSSTGPATLTVNQDSTQEYNSNFGGALRLVKLGVGQLTVSGTNCQQTGQTVIGGGKLRILSERTLGLAPASFVADQLVISNGATLLATGPCIFSDATRGITLGNGNGLFESAAGADLAVSNAVTGLGGLTKTGAGTLLLAGANSYQGLTMVSAGTLQIAQKQSLYGGAALSAGQFTVSSGATLAVNVGGTGEFTSEDVVSIASQGTSTTGLKPGAWLALRTDVPSATISGVIGNPSAGHGLNLDKLGTGTLELSGLNSYTGVTRISQGVLSVTSLADGGVASALGQSSKSKDNLIFAGGTLRYTGPTARTDRGFKYAAATNVYAIEVAQSNTVLTLGSISNAIFDSGNTIIRKTGPGTLALGRSYPSGGHGNYPVRAIHLLEGKMLLDNSGNNTIQQNLYCPATNGPSLLLGDGVELNYDTPLERGNDRLVRYVGTQTCARLTAGSLTLCGPDTYPANVHTFDVNDGADDVDLLIQSQFSVFPGATAISDVIKSGAGTLKFANNSGYYRGRTVVRNGQLVIGKSVLSNVVGPLGQSTNVIQFGDALSQSTDRPALIFEGTNFSALTCNRAIVVDRLSGVATIGSYSNITLTLSGLMAVSNTMNLLSMATGTNSLWVAGVISGPGGVTLSGSGTVVLMAQNSYTGATTLAAGTLRLSASERIANVSPLRLAGGSLKMNGATETVGALRVDGASEIVFDNGSLTCAESTAEVWNGTLVLRGWKSGVTRFFVGNSASLSQAQLDRITSPIGEKAAQLTTGEVVLMPLGTVFLFR